MPLSEKQMSYLALAWQCFETEPKIDYDKFKQVAGLASSHSARELMRVTKKKLKEEYGALSGTIASSNVTAVIRTGGGKASPSKVIKRTPTSKRGRAKQVASEVVTASEDGDDESPSKKAKTTKVKPEPKADAEEDDDDWLGMFQ
ncbi:hypothetical protein DOTSEDRAFT_38036 [Dothistroma septosporum NZE10]|uniref:Uncharacterized protein n=1 Tax=Dothistroma septosporum (strain NZE10 / CBS 128990) TaxID=675120 RepID=N1PD53_DOTSN|nr:hypothetical protein DOTSEDRAFT_38036 [Dothistroma septosporum NZE10]